MKRLYRRIELAFWDVIIPLLSESQFVRSSLQEVHNIYIGKNNIYLVLIFSWGAIALLVGYILGRAWLF